MYKFPSPEEELREMFLTNLWQFLLRPFRGYSERRRKRHLIKTFRANVDTMVLAMRLDPNLPEIIDLKACAPEIVDIGDGSGWLYLSYLNPYHSTSYRSERGTCIVPERLGILGNVLKPWTIVRYHFELADDLCKIIVNQNGVHLMSSARSDVDRAFAVIQCGAINPHRLGDDGRRYQNACAIVQEFTGIELDPAEHFGRTTEIVVWRQSTKEPWQVSSKQIALAV